MTRHYIACSFALAFGLLSLTAVAAKEPDNVDLAIERGLEYLLAVLFILLSFLKAMISKRY